MNKLLIGFVAIMSLLSSLGHASAQETSDTVVLYDGTLVRGTILEVSPQSHVIIRTASGETRRFDAAQVRYAGPSDQAPATTMGGATMGSPPPPPPPGTTAAPATLSTPATTPASNGDLPIRIVDDGEGLTLKLLIGTAYGSAGAYSLAMYSFRTICTAPCVGSLPQGSHQLVVTNARGRDYGVRGPVMITPGAELHLGIESRRRARGIMAGVGALLAIGGFVTMGVLIGSGYDFLDAGVTAGYAVGATGLLIGVFGLVFIRDR